MSVEEIEREVQGLQSGSSSRTSRSKPNKEQKDIYFLVVGSKGYQSWHHIKTQEAAETTSKVRKKLSPSFAPNPLPRIRTSFAALGPHIFAIGGVQFGNWDHPVPYVYSIDTRFPQEGWKPRAPLIKPRMDSYVVVINYSIYVFGGSRDPFAPWAEVYDITRNKWSPLYMDFSFLPTDFFSHIVVSAGNCPKILLCTGPFCDFIYCDLEARQCSFVVSNMDKPLYASAQVGNNIFLVTDQVHCCNLAPTTTTLFQQPAKDHKIAGPVLEVEQSLNFEFRSQVDQDGFKNFESALPPVDEYGRTYPATALVHVGNGDLCLLWSQPYKESLLIHCTMFTVAEKNDTDTSDDCSLVTHVKSYNVYEVEGIRLSKCVAVVSRPHKKKIRKSKKKSEDTT